MPPVKSVRGSAVVAAVEGDGVPLKSVRGSAVVDAVEGDGLVDGVVLGERAVEGYGLVNGVGSSSGWESAASTR